MVIGSGQHLGGKQGGGRGLLGAGSPSVGGCLSSPPHPHLGRGMEGMKKLE